MNILRSCTSHLRPDTHIAGMCMDICVHDYESILVILEKIRKNDRRQQEDEVEKKIGKLYKELLVRAYQVAWKNKKEASQRSKTS